MLRRLGAIAIFALAGLGCSGGGVATEVTVPSIEASVPDVLNPSTAAEMASLWCPIAYVAECQAAVVEAVAAAEPAAVCVFPNDTFAIVRPNVGDTAGAACGDDGSGTLRGIVVQP